MQFYKAICCVADASWAEKFDGTHLASSVAMKIASRSNDFNQKNKADISLFLVYAEIEFATIGIISCECVDLEKILSAFSKAIDLKFKDINLEEIMLSAANDMLEEAENFYLFLDRNKLLKKYGLDKLSNRRAIEFDENIINELPKKSAYEIAETLGVRDSFLPELDRIYLPALKPAMTGHPVHYLIEASNRDIRREMCRLLLRALYSNKRIRSRRYTFFNVKPTDMISLQMLDSLYNANVGGTVIARYNPYDDTEDNFASPGRRFAEIFGKTAKKYHNSVLTVLCLPQSSKSSKDIFYEYLDGLSFVELSDDFIFGERAESYLKMLARDAHIRPDKTLFRELEEGNGYFSNDLRELFDNWYSTKLKEKAYPQYKEITSTQQKMINTEAKGSAYDELMQMIGLDEAKTVINCAIDYYRAQMLFAEKGMKADRPTMHMVFTGNSGTAKTSVARLFAKIMRENGLLSNGELLEVGRGDLVARYVGHTAPNIQKIFEKASGGVLFIDEAYSLVDDRDGLFGDEAINTIVQEMENRRDDIVVIFAGYPDKMETFLQKNPGLRSRIAFHVPFDDYNVEELCDIARVMAEKDGLVLTDGATSKLYEAFNIAKDEPDFGNGRYVRNVIEKARMAQARRLLKMDFDLVKRKDVATICADDIDIPIKTQMRNKGKIGFTHN